jgi:hypothetical protein
MSSMSSKHSPFAAAVAAAIHKKSAGKSYATAVGRAVAAPPAVVAIPTTSVSATQLPTEPFVSSSKAREQFHGVLDAVRDGDNNALSTMPTRPTPEQLAIMTPLQRVSYDGEYLKHVEEQTPEICIAAVSENSFALKYVKEQTPEICIAAFNQLSKEWRRGSFDCAGMLLRMVKEQTTEVCEAAMAIDLRAFRSIREQTYDLCIKTVKRCGMMLNCCKYKFRTTELCVAAFRINPQAAKFFPNKTLAAKMQEGLPYWYKNLVARNPRIGGCSCSGCCSVKMHIRMMAL